MNTGRKQKEGDKHSKKKKSKEKELRGRQRAFEEGKRKKKIKNDMIVC